MHSSLSTAEAAASEAARRADTAEGTATKATAAAAEAEQRRASSDEAAAEHATLAASEAAELRKEVEEANASIDALQVGHTLYYVSVHL